MAIPQSNAITELLCMSKNWYYWRFWATKRFSLCRRTGRISLLQATWQHTDACWLTATTNSYIAPSQQTCHLSFSNDDPKQ
jgi:hypothetical protein